MKILSIDTASEVCSVAIIEDNKILQEINLENGNTHSQNLMPLISEALNKASLNINDIDLFACDNGPGSFTGIRIGIATLKAFRDVTLKPIIGVSSLKALASNLIYNNNNFNINCTDCINCDNFNYNYNNELICSIIDAKNNNVYCGLFIYENNEIKKIENYRFIDITSLLNYLKTQKFTNKKIFFVGNASIVYKDVIQFELNKKAIFTNNDFQNKLNAVNVANVAINKYSKHTVDFNNIVPLYLKKSNAEITLEEKTNEVIN